MKNVKHKIGITSSAILLLSILISAVGFFMRDIPESPTYTYINNKIVTHSWHNVFKVIIFGIILTMILITAIELILLIVNKVKNKEKIFGNVLLVSVTLMLSCAALLFGSLLAVGSWSDNDHDPQYYEFTDDRHTIVIKESSFLLGGSGTIYQIKDNNEAVVVGGFTTDDGGRNNGNYDIKWSENGAEIAYDNFCGDYRKAVETVTFE